MLKISENLGKIYSTTKNKCRNWLPIVTKRFAQIAWFLSPGQLKLVTQDADFWGGGYEFWLTYRVYIQQFDSGVWTFYSDSGYLKIGGCTLSETNIAIEHPAFWWYLPGNIGDFHGLCLLVSGRVTGGKCPTNWRDPLLGDIQALPRIFGEVSYPKSHREKNGGPKWDLLGIP